MITKVEIVLYRGIGIKNHQGAEFRILHEQ